MYAMMAGAYAFQGTVRMDKERNLLPWDLTALVRIGLCVILRGRPTRVLRSCLRLYFMHEGVAAVLYDHVLQSLQQRAKNTNLFSDRKNTSLISDPFDRK